MATQSNVGKSSSIDEYQSSSSILRSENKDVYHPHNTSNIFLVSASCREVSDSLNIATDETSTPTGVISRPSYVRSRPLLWRNWFLTFTYCMVFWSFGLGVACLGPTLLDLGCQITSDFSKTSWVIFSQAFFILVGSASGGWIGDKFSKHVVLFGSVLSMAIAMTIIPFCIGIGTLALTLAVMGFFMGIIDTLANLSMIELHGDRPGPQLQALHFFYGLGAFLAPMVVKPFLSNYDCSPLIDSPLPPTSIISLDQAVSKSRQGLQYSFWIMASMQLPVLFFLSVVVIRERFYSKKNFVRTSYVTAKEEGTLEVEDKSATKTAVYHVILLTSLTALFLFLVDGLQAIYSSYIYSFAIKVFEKTNSSEAAYLNASFWGSLALGRLFSIFISTVISPQKMLLGNIGGCLSGVILIMLVPQSRLSIYVGTVLVGLFLSSVYPTSLSLVKGYISVTRFVTTACVVGAASGEMFMPAYEFDSLGPKSFLIICLVLACLGFLVYVILLITGERGSQKSREKSSCWKSLSC